MKKFFGSLLILLFIAGCSTAPQTAPTQTSETEMESATEIIATTSVPTEAPTAVQTTEVPTVQPSPTPEGQIFRDDFSGSLADGWTWNDEVRDRWTITNDGWLQIVGEEDLILTYGRQSNLLCRDLPEGDYAISTHLVTKPNANWQQAAIFFLQDADNYVAINRGFCEFCEPGTGGNGFYMDYKVNGVTGSYKMGTTDTDVYLKLEKKGDVISGYYSTDPSSWTRLGRFGNLFKFSKTCLGAGNGSPVDSDIVALYDYFEITEP